MPRRPPLLLIYFGAVACLVALRLLGFGARPAPKVVDRADHRFDHRMPGPIILLGSPQPSATTASK